MPGCSAINCTNSSEKGFLMKRFPRDKQRRKEWSIRMQRDWIPTDGSVLCEVHFAPEMWELTREDGTRKLRLNAVPTIFSFTNTSGRKRLIERISDTTEKSCNEEEPKESTPTSDMPNKKILSVIMPSESRGDRNYFANFTDSSQSVDNFQETFERGNKDNQTEDAADTFEECVIKQEGLYEDQSMGEFHCRTCLNIIDKQTGTEMTKNFFLDKTIRDVITFLVPELESKLEDDEAVCGHCLSILTSTMEFIVKCVEVDEVLTGQKDKFNGVQDSFSENGENADIADDSAEELDTEHDYCVKILGMDGVTETEDLSTKGDAATLAINDDRTGNNIEIEYNGMLYSGNDVEMIKEWLPEHEGEMSESDRQTVAHKKKTKIKENETLCCSTCSESFETQTEYEDHLEIHPPQDSDVHNLASNNTNIFICEVCGKGFKEHNTLRCHLKNHTSQESYICDKCSKVFKSKRLLDIHIKYVHDKVYTTQCTICGKLSRNSTSLKTHMRLVHFKEKPFECNICHKKFGRSDYLHNHKLRHEEGQNLSDKPQLETQKVRRRTRRPFKIHDTGEPVPCKFCGQWYKDLVRLKRHLETHLKRYPCQFCPLTFPRNILCKRHEEIHRGGTVNFSRCNVCWKKFKTKEALDEHVTCHNNPQHFCDLCGKTFNRKFLLSHHKLMEHSNIPDKEQPEEIIYDSLLEVGGLAS